MKVILREDVENLGKAGDVVKIADGFGRNYLIPKRLAVLADVRNLQVLEHDRRVIGARAKKTRKTAEELGGKLSSLFLTIPAKAGGGGGPWGGRTRRQTPPGREKTPAPRSTGRWCCCPSRSSRSGSTR